jgi:hypothetical protein
MVFQIHGPNLYRASIHRAIPQISTATQDTGQLEQGDHHDPAKVIAFLEKWKKSKATEKKR